MNKKVSPRMQVNGAYMMGVIDSLEEVHVRPFREKHGLTEIDPQQWYPAQQIVDFYADIEKNGNMFDLIAIGMKAVEHVEYPPQVDTLEKALGMATEMHKGGWRDGNPGELLVEFIGDRHVRLTFEDLPLPIDLVYGLCYGTIKRFAPSGSIITVRREKIDDAYLFDLQW